MLAVVVALVVATASVATGAGAVWNMTAVGAPLPDTGVVIAVVDTGVEGSHPAFGSRVLPQINIVKGSNGDPNGHGTHVAGTAAGGSINCGDFTGNASAAVGVAPGAKILPVRVLDDDGSGTVSGVAEGIKKAADAGADVINLSLGTDLNGLTGASGALVDAIEYAWDKGSIPVLAAGNGGLVGGLFGSGYGNINAVVVTAVTRQGGVASYATDVGSAKWGIAAPGGAGNGKAADDIVSAYSGNACGLLAGTSMAAPHVSGALAILRARGLSPQQAVERVLSTAKRTSPSRTYGSGILDLGAAVSGIPRKGAGSTTTTTTAAPSVPAPTVTTVPSTTSPPSSTTSSAPSTTTSPTTAPATTAAPTTAPPTTEPSGSTTSSPPTSEVAAADVSLDVDDGGRVSGGLAAAAGLACAAMWLVLGRSAARLRD
ncbi:MAG: S8 family serine peptidase [Acidimicrobiales bacterium]|nr:S8 family serine peptidase [Acidimicrobiales bacterium]